MLVLSRKAGERICIGDGIVIAVQKIRGDQVRLGIEAPEKVAIFREEVLKRVRRDFLASNSEPLAGGTTQAGSGEGRL